MSFFDAIKRGVRRGVAQGVAEADVDAVKAWRLSRRALREFLKDEGVQVGDVRYDWGPQAGRTIVEEYEIAHWDAKS